MDRQRMIQRARGNGGPMPCGCCRQDGSYGYVFNDAGEAKVCPLCDGTGSTDPDYSPRVKIYTINPAQQGQTFLTASSTLEGQIKINSNYDFCLVWTAAVSTSLTAGTSVGGGFQVELWDPGKSRSWQDGPVYVQNMAGNGVWYPIGMVPQRIPANWEIPWRVTETSTASNTIQIALIGFEMVPIVPQQATQGA